LSQRANPMELASHVKKREENSPFCPFRRPFGAPAQITFYAFWDTARGVEIRQLGEPKDPILFICFSPGLAFVECRYGHLFRYSGSLKASQLPGSRLATVKCWNDGSSGVALNPRIRRWLLIIGAFLVVFVGYLFVYFRKK